MDGAERDTSLGRAPGDRPATPAQAARRIQRRRAKGWRMPEGAVYVGRPTRWGNPFRLGDPHPHRDGRLLTAADAVALFERDTGPGGRYELDVSQVRTHLGGRDLACWCPLAQPCHADVLLRIANPNQDREPNQERDQVGRIEEVGQ